MRSVCYILASLLIIGFMVNCKTDKKSFQEKGMDKLSDTIVSDTLSKFVKIDDSLVNKIKPIIEDWLEYYQLNISDFRLSEKSELNMDSLNERSSPYYAAFSKADDVYIPQLHDYSPDKTLYIDLLSTTGVALGRDKKYHFAGSDDCQQIRLYNRKDRINVMISFRGISNFADAAFWIDNNMFVLVGYNAYEELGVYTVEVYNLLDKTCNTYTFPKELLSKETSYIVDVNMKKRGVIID